VDKELTQEILLHSSEKLHIDRRLTAAKRAQKADRHEITELVARGIAAARIMHIIEIADQCRHLEAPSRDEASGIQFQTAVRLQALLPYTPDDPGVLRFAIQAGLWGEDPELAEDGYALLLKADPVQAQAARRFPDSAPPAPSRP